MKTFFHPPSFKGYKGDNCDQRSSKLRITKHTLMIGLIILAGLLLSAILAATLIQMKRRGRFVTAHWFFIGTEYDY